MWLVLLAACASPPPLPPLPVPAAGGAVVPPSTRQAPAPTEPRYAATVVLVAYAGAKNAPLGVTRTRDEASSLARSLHARAKDGEDLGEIASRSSDALRGRAGALGIWATGTMDPALEAAVRAVEPGAIGPLAETAEGWWVVRRDRVELRRFGHILVSYQGAWRNLYGRTRPEAEVRAAEALRRVEAGEPFVEVATAMSDAGRAGADLGLHGVGQLLPAIEGAGWPLAIGEHTAVVESAHGLHVLIRLE